MDQGLRELRWTEAGGDYVWDHAPNMAIRPMSFEGLVHFCQQAAALLAPGLSLAQSLGVTESPDLTVERFGEVARGIEVTTEWAVKRRTVSGYGLPDGAEIRVTLEFSPGGTKDGRGHLLVAGPAERRDAVVALATRELRATPA